MSITDWTQLLDGLGRHDAALQAVIIVCATFILEDAATVFAAMQAQTGAVSFPVALASLYVGIVAGDLGLYALGALSRRSRTISRLIPEQRTGTGREWLAGRVFHIVFMSRFLPGARLPTYTACGFLNADLKQFALATVLATSLWTSLLFGVSLRIGVLLMEHLGAWRWVGAAGFALALVVMMRLAARSHEARR